MRRTRRQAPKDRRVAHDRSNEKAVLVKLLPEPKRGRREGSPPCQPFSRGLPVPVTHKRILGAGAFAGELPLAVLRHAMTAPKNGGKPGEMNDGAINV